MTLNNFTEKLTITNIKSKKLIFIYLILIPFLIFMLTSNTNYNLTLSIIILLGFTIGLKDLKKYLNKIDTWEKTLAISLILLGIQGLFSLIGLTIYPDNNPQGLTNLALSSRQLVQLIKILPIIAFGEEFFKFFTFIALLSLIKESILKKLTLATFLSALIFGFIHVINYKFNVGYLLTLWAIPSYFFLVYFKSIYPLIISHFLWDGLSLGIHSYEYSWTIWLFYLVLYGGFIYKYRYNYKIKELFIPSSKLNIV